LVTDYGSPEVGEWHVEICSLFIFADKVGATSLKNDVMNRIRDRQAQQKVFWCGTIVAEIHQNLPQGSKLREYVLDQLVYNSEWSHFEASNVDDFESFPTDFWMELVRRLRWSRVISQKIDRQSRCYYHEHDELAPQRQCSSKVKRSDTARQPGCINTSGRAQRSDRTDNVSD